MTRVLEAQIFAIATVSFNVDAFSAIPADCAGYYVCRATLP